ncbi:MAG: diacylglycerol kinase family protein [Polyangiales bacterium]
MREVLSAAVEGPLPKVLVIANPSSGGGSTARRIPEIERALRRQGLEYQLAATTRAGHASEIAASATARGIDVIAIVGGDGTLNEVAQAFMAKDGSAILGPDLAIIPSGSGGDFRKTLGLSGSIDEAVARIRHGQRRKCDLGVLELHDHDGKPIRHAFINIASFGVGGLVDKIVNESPKWFGGKAAFFLGSLRATLQYKNAPVRIKVDGVPFYEGPIFNVAMCNGRFFGGGMKIAPHADLGDGRLEVVALGDLGKAEVMRLSQKIYAGAHLGEPGVTVGHGKVIEAEPLHAWAAVLLDVDGETPGKLPVRATLREGALTLRS